MLPALRQRGALCKNYMCTLIQKRQNLGNALFFERSRYQQKGHKGGLFERDRRISGCSSDVRRVGSSSQLV
jgi:hypothetical protein